MKADLRTFSPAPGRSNLQSHSIIVARDRYPTQEPAHRRGRLDGVGIVHVEKYHALTKPELAEITRRYDDKSQHLGQVEDWDTKGHKHYLDWYFKEWVRVDQKRPASETPMLRRLKRSGFIEAQT